MAVEGERLSPPVLVISGLVVLTVGFFCLPGLQEPPPAVAALWLGALLLQASAVELPGLGLFSSAPAFGLGAATLGPKVGGFAVLICLSSLLLRALVRHPHKFFTTLQLNLADAVPELVAICLVAKGAGWFGCLLYVPLALLWSRQVTLLAHYAGVAGVALLVAGLDVWKIAALFFVLLALQRRLPVPPAPRSRRQSGKPALPTPAQLAMESLPGKLLVCKNQADVLKAVLATAGAVCSSRSQVVFLLQEAGLVPVAYHSPLSERLAAYFLLGQPEPVVETAWRTQSHQVFPPLTDGGRRFFEGEHAGAALCLEGEGVLYVGRVKPALSEQELDHLEWLAGRAVTALRVVRSQEAERQALQAYQREHDRLQEELQRVQSLLEGTRQMASTLDFVALGERLEVMLRTSIPHDFGAILTLDAGQLHLRRQWGANLNPPATLAVCQTVLTNEVPLTLDRESRLVSLVAAQTGLVAAPMQLEGGTTGVLLIGSVSRAVFEREHQDLLWMIGCLAAISFSNAGLHQEVLDTQSQLLHAGKLAAIGQLAAGVAHELNTPLGAIQLSVDGLMRQLKEDQPASVQRKLERANLAADQARQIVDKLLVYSRREDKAEQERVELAQVVKQTLELVHAQLRQDGVQVEVELSAVPPVMGSSLELRQVLTNLLLNARDAALSPGATSTEVKIHTRFQDGWVFVEVFDHGPGVPPEIEKRIFEPFFTTKEVGRGTGLGLSISHRIAATYGGALEHRSPPGAAPASRCDSQASRRLAS